MTARFAVTDRCLPVGTSPGTRPARGRTPRSSGPHGRYRSTLAASPPLVRAGPVPANSFPGPLSRETDLLGAWIMLDRIEPGDDVCACRPRPLRQACWAVRQRGLLASRLPPDMGRHTEPWWQGWRARPAAGRSRAVASPRYRFRPSTAATPGLRRPAPPRCRLCRPGLRVWNGAGPRRLPSISPTWIWSPASCGCAGAIEGYLVSEVGSVI
jgi:hypothetical protein